MDVLASAASRAVGRAVGRSGCWSVERNAVVPGKVGDGRGNDVSRNSCSTRPEKLPPAVLGSSEVCPTVAEMLSKSCPKVVDSLAQEPGGNRPKLKMGRFGPHIGRCGPNYRAQFGRLWPHFGRVGQHLNNLAKFDRPWPNLTNIDQHFTQVDRTWSNVGQSWPKRWPRTATLLPEFRRIRLGQLFDKRWTRPHVGRFLSIGNRIRPTLARMRATLAGHRQSSANLLARSRPDLARNRPELARTNRPDFAQIWPDFDQSWPQRWSSNGQS